MAQEIWMIDDIDRPNRPTPGLLEVGDRIVLTVDEQDNVTLEIPGKVPRLSGTRRVQGWFHWLEAYVFQPMDETIYTIHAFPRVTGQEHWLEGFIDRIILTGGELGDVRDTETWTAMKEPPDDPTDPA
ncbi:MAG TPA: hypothetical protein VKM72_33610 [Thermoanaerobaculia bacterium]|nr:hypothetical protein [Thermoanaerobaculia bacterium]